MTDDSSPDRNGATEPRGDGKRYWLEAKRNIDLLFWLLCLICALLSASDFIYHRHLDFEMESYWGAYVIFGFVCFVGIVFAGKALREPSVRRDLAAGEIQFLWRLHRSTISANLELIWEKSNEPIGGR
jgi:hypothetical protein